MMVTKVVNGPAFTGGILEIETGRAFLPGTFADRLKAASGALPPLNWGAISGNVLDGEEGGHSAQDQA
jgi:hypothetical protein